MRALLDKASAIDNDDLVGVADGREPVCDDDTRETRPAQQMIDRRLQLALVLVVEGTRRLVKDKDLGFTQQRACNRHTLPLTARELRTPAAYVSLVAFRQLTDEVVCVRHACGRLDLCLARSLSAVADILLDRALEQRWLLHHHSNLLTQPAHIQRAQVDPV
eukprot:CAMPEP_0181172326 /NCGR_PEP_ID=MMETSP1096-20121128/2390_1 /TAXON_ID=156174 ORGANISM="Chrysochromulina ericina, Strain CCMP281" /NCGR_SAMPLE_ID=MMETSP1096 /ASSEMBLY_ACC=CAM_ASM_000453 /LENGTH=161 /DNA_ID=CAMNT_0023260047 /DNA_START=483 /DNA_END=968 /DNA_ORIENTATION=+